jgi:DNA mismatch repair protein MutL
VVRELLDNALDAGAGQIVVRLEAGGVRSIVVEDDGAGIAAADLPLALARHATSKIATLAELEAVATMGFRGEALAAIASVAELVLTSRTAAAAHATRVDARSGELQPAARAIGTTVEVRELFAATPARRKFLKRDATEAAHALEAVRRHALARPDVGFAVLHDRRPLAQWRAGASAARIGAVLGADFVAASHVVDAAVGPLRISGHVGRPDIARARGDLQYLYVNGRCVRDRVLAHAVRAAYEDQLHGSRQPAYALFVELAPSLVDVNVHPAKSEVRFRDSRAVHEAVREAVERALASGARDLDFLRLGERDFSACPSASIDYAVMEHTAHGAMVPGEFGWSDVGSWSALQDALPTDGQGNVIAGDVLTEGTTGCYLHSTSRLIGAVGLKDHVVVETKDAVLVAPRERVQDVKSLVNQLKAQGRYETSLHREVFRPWGSYDSVDQGDRFQVKRLVVKPGASMSLQLHHHRAEHWIVVSGTARITRGEETFLLGENESTYIPMGTRHRIENPGKVELHIIEVQSGSFLGEDDIVRFEDIYGR